MRNPVRKVEWAEATFEVLPPAAVVSELPRLWEISDAWLNAKGAREKSFSMGSFSEPYLTRFPHALVRHEGRIDAFGNLRLGADGREFSLDLMRYDPAASPDAAVRPGGRGPGPAGDRRPNAIAFMDRTAQGGPAGVAGGRPAGRRHPNRGPPARERLVAREGVGPADQRWYWAALAILDRRYLTGM